ncbi:MAG: endonuclease/exonuclease/phosphatase family protein [Planctomycetota bacterium]|nr:endonuclease/exonuclease/phosphatase family protein [Planctomycetota bacterium]
MKHLRPLRRWFSRRELAARVMSDTSTVAPDDTSSELDPGLVLIQIDGLPKRELERAIASGRMPFLRRLLERERFQLGTFYSGLPATTPAVQAELFYGVRTAVPAFAFRSRRTRETVEMLEPEVGALREIAIAQAGGPPLLEGGSAYCDVFRGGAAEPHFCVASLTFRAVMHRIRPWLWPALTALYLPTALRVLALAAAEMLVGFGEALLGWSNGEKLKSEFEFIHKRVLVGVILREWMVAGARLDATRGLPVIHVNFLGYDEKAHRRGPDSAFAHRSLPGIDQAIRRIAQAARRSRRREYEVWIYADHGQERTTQYEHQFGRGIDEAVSEVATRVLSLRPQRPPKLTTIALGPIGHVYGDPPLDESDCGQLAEALVQDADVPVTYLLDDRGVKFWTRTGQKGRLPEDAQLLLGTDHPQLDDVADDLVALCRHPEAGQIVIGGWFTGSQPLSFVGENGGHAGPGPHETGGFTLLPPDTPVSGQTVRPTELRNAVLSRMVAHADRWSAVCGSASTRRDTVRLLTYNVHGCVGTDGRLSPRRIARAVAECDPDIVALQELDVGRRRSGMRDQAREIADLLGMICEFHPSFRFEDEQYGNAVLSRFPLRLVSAGALPQRVPQPAEPRGALWVEIDMGGQMLQVITTHLGLNGTERLRQVEALLGPEWFGSPLLSGPAVLCGDLNAGSRSMPYRRLAARLRDATQTNGRPRATFPSRWPVVRIDHVFASDDIELIETEVVRTTTMVTASDHLPLLVEFRLPILEHKTGEA